MGRSGHEVREETGKAGGHELSDKRAQVKAEQSSVSRCGRR